MATLIPAIGTCLPRMTSGKRRLAERLAQKLDEGHDFQAEWLRLVTQMVDPATHTTACWCRTTTRKALTSARSKQFSYLNAIDGKST